MIKIIKNNVITNSKSPSLPFVTEDKDGIIRIYFKDNENICCVNMNTGIIGDEYYKNIENIISNFTTLEEKIVDVELVIKSE